MVPIIIYLLSTLPILPSGENNDWVGFWGGYLGSMIGSAIALYVLFKTLADEHERQRRQERLAYCEIAEFNQSINFSLPKIKKYYTFAKSLKGTVEMYEAAIEAINSITRSSL